MSSLLLKVGLTVYCDSIDCIIQGALVLVPSLILCVDLICTAPTPESSQTSGINMLVAPGFGCMRPLETKEILGVL